MTFAHDAASLPIAQVVSITLSGSKLLGVMRFPPEGTYEVADTVFQLIRAGILRSTSVEWCAVEWKQLPNGRGRDFTKSIMIGLSIVNMPANPDALLSEAARRGINLAPLGAYASRSLARGRIANQEHREMLSRIAEPQQRPYASPRASADRGQGFASAGEFFRAVAVAKTGGDVDRRLVRAPTGASEDNATAGGFLAPDVVLSGIVDSMYAGSAILPLVSRTTLEAGNLASVKLPAISETNRATGARFGGVGAYWVAEAANVSTTFPKMRLLEFSGHELIAFATVTNELLSDASILGSFLTRSFAEELQAMSELAILVGSGAGMPQGLLSSGSKVTVAKQTGQAPGTILAENIDDMWSALPAPCRSRAVWLVNEKAEGSALSKMVTTVGTGGAPAGSSLAMYMPSGTPGVATLKGRPVYPMEWLPALGATGDIVLADLSQYEIVDGEMRVDFSSDVQFTTDSSVFRLSYRIDGQSLWPAPITAYDGSTRAPFVVLAPRA